MSQIASKVCCQHLTTLELRRATMPWSTHWALLRRLRALLPLLARAHCQCCIHPIARARPPTRPNRAQC